MIFGMVRCSLRTLLGSVIAAACCAGASYSFAQPATAACAEPAHHALDFWIGDWDVRSGDDIVATSRIERSPVACAIVETYRQKDGYSGTSVSFYDPALKMWRQTWVDSSGSVGEFTGAATSGRMQFAGETHRADGERIHRRMTLLAEQGTVRQTSLASRDGAQWRPHYELVYTRR